MTKILMDTDVILDFFFDRKPFSEKAAKILSLCEDNRIKVFITPVIVSNVYYLLRKTAKHEKVVEKLKMLISITEILVINRDSILQALYSHFNDFEDALQNYSAELHKEIEIIVTRNIKDYKNSTLVIMSPDNYLKARISDH